MKIENFALEMNSQKLQTQRVETTFEMELVSFNRIDEMDYLKKLRYEMVAQFLRMFQIDTRPNSYEINTNLQAGRRESISYEYYKHEQLDVQMKGFVQTDTQKIELDINLSLSNSFMEKAHIQKTQFHDPLVLNFDGEIPSLDSTTFSFDIDSDGESDQISLLNSGNGFLALDKNENGVIDDGSELFGTTNGHGFYDLKRYDSDKNGWIDENDPILDGLRIWMKDENEDKLVALGELGIGALYLGFTQNSHNLRGEDNEILGKIHSNGLYLNENGTSGLLTQIDFARREDTQEDSALSKVLQFT